MELKRENVALPDRSPPTRTETKKALRSYRKLNRAEAPKATLALNALPGKIEMHPKKMGRAVAYVTHCDLKLGEIFLPSVSTNGSGDSNQPTLNLDTILTLDLNLEEALEPMYPGLPLIERY